MSHGVLLQPTGCGVIFLTRFWLCTIHKHLSKFQSFVYSVHDIACATVFNQACSTDQIVHMFIIGQLSDSLQITTRQHPVLHAVAAGSLWSWRLAAFT
jgi:hypothetical protein